MSQKYEKLKTLLKELFQLDQPDLDFGLYRIMHAKAAEVTQFLDKDLLPQVKEAFGLYRTADKAELEKELATAIAQAHDLGVDPETTQKVRDLHARIKNDAVDVGALESEVYDHLYSFFSRYYDHEGDFLTLRRYREGVYAIPYEGEEVKFHWANRDQYYIKTSEYLRDYAFRLRPESEETPMRVHFRLVDATEGEHGNVKAANGKERVFILAAEGFVAEENGEFVIRFEYRPATLTDWSEDTREGKTKPPAQKDMIALAVRRVLAVPDARLGSWIAELGKQHITTSGEKADYSRLEAHLRRYTARNTFDYFIHTDLGGFLRRELDFYIKNEVMHLDDVENETAPRVEQYLSKIKVLRRIAGKIIDFLAQLEDFQKKLWLKKKFVVAANYCITLDRVPEEFYTEIAANDAQRDEWVRLFAIDEIKGDMVTPGYSAPLTVNFLNAHRNLAVDTRLLPSTLSAAILSAVDNLDGVTAGLFVQSENRQAISLLTHKLDRKVDCVYIDPPYNTSENTFVYKNSYKHSSWIAMIQERLEGARRLLCPGGVLEIAIDDTETAWLRAVLDALFGETNRVATIAVEVNPAGQNLRPNTPALSHDYCHIYAYDIDRMQMLLRELTDEERAQYKETDSKGSFLWDNLRRRGGNSRPTDRPGQWFPLYVDRLSRKVSVDRFDGAEELWPIDPQGEERIWRVNPAGARREIAAGEVSVIEKAGRLEIVKKTRMPDGKKPKSLWKESRYSATTHGTKLLIDILGEQRFSYPKSVYLVMDCLRYWMDESSLVFDFFAGSGTTAHAVMRLNAEDGGDRRFILAEVGDYFDSVLLPRVQRVAYSDEWQRGKPQSRDGSFSYVFKVIRLESYEDALNNLETRRTTPQRTLLEAAAAQGADGLKEQYLLRYMLDVETRGSQSLLNVRAFTDPTAYELNVKRPGSDQSRQVTVDLLETFNYLIGLTVRHIAAPQSFTAEFERDSEKRLCLKGRLKQDAAGPWWFRTVTGSTPDGRSKILVIWRKLTGDPEQDNLVLDEWFTKQGYSTKDYEFDVLYVNGDNNLENLKVAEDTWKVRLIEDDFHRLMFDAQQV